jgi:radical SAM protein with 4Fe4S-binding SPASM domain
VDRAYMEELGLAPSPLWEGPEDVEILSAPLEVHFAITNKCSGGCHHCYMGSGESEQNELDTEKFKSALNILKELGVFHIALGGGEALERSDLFEIAEYARFIEIIPNLTTNGQLVTREVADRMKVFGQVNLSLDGVGESSSVFRGVNNFDTVDKAAKLLTGAGVHTGINCVLGGRNFSNLAAIFEYAQSSNLNEIEILRYKPSGRASKNYQAKRMTDTQYRDLLPVLARLSDEFDITTKVDCSLVPMLCYGRPPLELLEKTATYGCEAGNVLLGIRADGRVAGCSFMDTSDLSVFDLLNKDALRNTFSDNYTWAKQAPMPCRDCDYLRICKGGCRAVTMHLTGDPKTPDPECPFVVDYLSQNSI